MCQKQKILRTGGRITQKSKRDLNDPDKHDVLTHTRARRPGYEAKLALEALTVKLVEDEF